MSIFLGVLIADTVIAAEGVGAHVGGAIVHLKENMAIDVVGEGAGDFIIFHEVRPLHFVAIPAVGLVRNSGVIDGAGFRFLESER